ncbi:MAG: NAD(P)-binding oxidoreductase [Bacteroidales bacterium]|jgi:putative NADH-flavin reductase|nr:NAD(P)-binding oxidoreductase [Bacteroidales bacterium]
MKVLVVGATGATGTLLLEQLLERGHEVKAIVRSSEKIPQPVKNHAKLKLIEGELLKLDDEEMAQHVKGCDAVASCLGHNITIKGMYGHPRRLVTDAAKRLTKAIAATHPEKKVKYILMNTSGNRNRSIKEPIALGQRMVTALLRLLLPPHVDNEKAADFLWRNIGNEHKQLEWVAVRPDGLINEDKISEYEIHPSPIRNPIFNPGKTSRINVAHFMASLIDDDEIWQKWKGQMPVIYNEQPATINE